MVLMIEILMFAISFNFLGMGSRIQLILLAITLADILKKRSIVVNLKTGIMFCFLISYALIAFKVGYFSLTFISTNLACPFMMCYWGREVFVRSSHTEGQLRKECYIIYAGFFAIGLIALIYSIMHGISNRMEVYSIWGGQNSGIQQTIFFLLPESLLLYFIIFGGKPLTKTIGIFASAASIINILYFAGRSGFIIILIANGFALLFYLYQGTAKTRFRTILVAATIIAVIALLYATNTFDLQTIWKQSNMYDRLYISKSGMDSKSRSEMWMTGLKELFKAPLGSDFKYAHNFWIDIALEGGLPTGLLLLIYSILSLIDVYKFVVENKNISAKTRMFILALYIGTISAFMVEPMMQGIPLLVGNLFFMDSAIYEYNSYNCCIGGTDLFENS